MNDEAVKEFIEHVGVKGMHWGVRKDRGSVRPSSSESKKVSELRKRKPHQLTNKQLKLVNERLNLEQNFKRMNPGPAKAGKEIAAGILGTIGLGVTAYNVVHSPAGKAAIAAGKKFLRIRTKGQLKLF